MTRSDLKPAADCTKSLRNNAVTTNDAIRKKKASASTPVNGLGDLPNIDHRTNVAVPPCPSLPELALHDYNQKPRLLPRPPVTKSAVSSGQQHGVSDTMYDMSRQDEYQEDGFVVLDDSVDENEDDLNYSDEEEDLVIEGPRQRRVPEKYTPDEKPEDDIDCEEDEESKSADDCNDDVPSINTETYISDGDGVDNYELNPSNGIRMVSSSIKRPKGNESDSTFVPTDDDGDDSSVDTDEDKNKIKGNGSIKKRKTEKGRQLTVPYSFQFSEFNSWRYPGIYRNNLASEGAEEGHEDNPDEEAIYENGMNKSDDESDEDEI